IRNSPRCPTRLPLRLSYSWGPATCQNPRTARDNRRIRILGRIGILWEDVSPARRPSRALGLGDRSPPGLKRAPPRTRRDSPGPAPAAAVVAALAARRVLPVDLEREGATLCARQRGHGPLAAQWPLGARGAESGSRARRRAAAEHTEPVASLICQSGLETSAISPSALKSPWGRAQPPSCGGQPSLPVPGLARRERRGGGRARSAELQPGYPDRLRALPAALTSGRKERGRMTQRPRSAGRKLHLPEAAKLPGNAGKRGEPLARSGDLPRDS
uniref:Uncharacterized protein n=1 Tax=Propithecus coquereli TaxID=379532 RepID=A0A2K6GHP1_PROCO